MKSELLMELEPIMIVTVHFAPKKYKLTSLQIWDRLFAESVSPSPTLQTNLGKILWDIERQEGGKLQVEG